MRSGWNQRHGVGRIGHAPSKKGTRAAFALLGYGLKQL
jgi:hypothetical protein